MLFDEIEKAHPDTHNLLLQVLEDGRLTDGEGTTVDFRNTIVVLTSNIGNHGVGAVSSVGFGTTASDGETNLRAAKELLPPELLARLDHVLPFGHLDHAALQKIATSELRALKKRLAEKEITLSYPTTLAKHLVKDITLETENARAVRKVIHKDLQQKIATHLLTHPDTKNITLGLTKDALTIDQLPHTNHKKEP